jgi:hypothetical protein
LVGTQDQTLHIFVELAHQAERHMGGGNLHALDGAAEGKFDCLGLCRVDGATYARRQEACKFTE